ncbi:hypothetical protein V6N12_007551 [Hibiscus sabdariffa]|uniref:Uncharacterized protein n=1 Tax=Hibiscus sabdariffa TaxID=183260 RepID=A0ABR2F239_9ROSI
MVASSTPIKIFFNEEIRKDEHEKFINSMTAAKRAKMLADLCKSGTTWTVSPKGSRSVKRVALIGQARRWNHFLKANLIPTTHNEIVSKECMESLHSIIVGRN